jgi:hypothetical protein
MKNMEIRARKIYDMLSSELEKFIKTEIVFVIFSLFPVHIFLFYYNIFLLFSNERI